jgi:rRNA maturation endonuclease Nob1
LRVRRMEARPRSGAGGVAVTAAQVMAQMVRADFCMCADCLARDPARVPFKPAATRGRAPQRTCRACGRKFERRDGKCPRCGTVAP